MARTLLLLGVYLSLGGHDEWDDLVAKLDCDAGRWSELMLRGVACLPPTQ